jgi:hypothetical protein
VSFDVRKIGLWMVALGGAAMSIGLVGDAVHHANDATLASREGIFDLSGFWHALFFGGICVSVLGLFATLFGREIYKPGARVTVGRRLLQVGAPIAAVVLIAGCASIASSSSLGKPSATGHDHSQTTSAASASSGHSHGEAGTGAAATAATGSAHAHDESGHGTVIAGTATGRSPCEIAAPTPASPGQVGAGSGGGSNASAVAGEHGGRGMVVQTPLTAAERVLLEQQMAQARSVIAKYPTVKDAEAAGYAMSTPYVPCIGAHYTNVGLIMKFDPAAPSELLYDGTKPDSKIVGLSYLVYHKGGPPEGFAGANDHWHQHNANGGLCFGKSGVVIGGEEESRAECAAKGGQKRELTDIWMAHAWVVPGFECTWGVFAGECPELGGKIGGSAWE